MRLIISFFTFLTIVGCQPESLFIDVKPEPPRLVVSSHVIPDKIVIITLTTSFSALSAKDINTLNEELLSSLLVDSAEVLLTTKDRVYVLTALSDGIYTTTLDEIIPGMLVTLVVNDTLRGRNVTSSTYVLPNKKLDSISFRKSQSSDTLSTLNYQFIDEEEKNWYVIQAFDLNGIINPEWIRIETIDGVPEIIIDSTEQIIFSTEITPLFTDILSDISFNTELVKRSKELSETVSDTLLVFFIETDQGYFDFLQVRQRSGGFLASLTNEPINYPGNIIGGFGYFALHQPQYKIVIASP